MSSQKVMKRDFENPSLLWRLEDMLKNLGGEWFIYGQYVSMFQLKGNERVLDFGCGGGIGSRCIIKKLSKGGHLTCVDISKFWVSKAKKRLKQYPNVEFKVGYIADLDIPNSFYDIISIFYVLHDIEPTIRSDVVNLLLKKLKYKGRLYISEPTKRSHGIASEEILTLMSRAGLLQKSYRNKRSSYMGEFYKPLR